MSGGGSSQKFTPTSTRVDPAIAPSRDYAVSEATRLYNQGGPKYFEGQNYIDPSAATNSALSSAMERANAGNPLVPAAQKLNMSLINGDYLNGNQFFDGAFTAAMRSANQNFANTIDQQFSNASLAGRYGSDAMAKLMGQSMDSFARANTDTAGTLAYQNYAAERQAQNAAIGNAGALAALDYADIEKMLQVGQIQEGYSREKLAADMDRWNFDQTMPYQNLSNYGNFLSGLPQGNDTFKMKKDASAGTATTQWPHPPSY